MELSYSSVPEISNPNRKVFILAVLTIGIGYFLWQEKKKSVSEKEGETHS